MTKGDGYQMEIRHISIHTALAGCDSSIKSKSCKSKISIHTALAGCDATGDISIKRMEISIHTALAGCDDKERRTQAGMEDFNPHSPRRL